MLNTIIEYAFTNVYGEEYANIINEKLKNSEIFFYENNNISYKTHNKLNDENFINKNREMNMSGVVPNFGIDNKLFNTVLIKISDDFKGIYNVVTLHEMNHVIGSNYKTTKNGINYIDYGLSERNFTNDYKFTSAGVEYLDEVVNHDITLQSA